MRVYTRAHQFYCGIDLHARSLHLCVLDQAGTVVLHLTDRHKALLRESQCLPLSRSWTPAKNRLSPSF